VAGGTAAVQPLFLYTTDGGQTFNNHGMNDSATGAMMSIRMGTSTWGVAGALGFLGLPCGAVSTDGQTWNTMDVTSAICAFPGAATVNDGQTGVLIGSWANRRDWNGNGIKITTDAGKTWKEYNGDNADVPARYGSFLSKDAGYVTSSTWPGDTASNLRQLARTQGRYTLSRHLSVDLKTQNVHFEHPRSGPIEEYVGYIAAVSNAGQDWKMVLNKTGEGFFFNEIDCVDVNTCWAVTEGVDHTGNATASIYATTDAWATYTVQLTVPGGVLIAVDMLNAQTGWVGGALVEGNFKGSYQGLFYKTTDGVNWTLDSQVENFMVTDLSVTDASHAYAAGIQPDGLGSFASYTPSN